MALVIAFNYDDFRGTPLMNNIANALCRYESVLCELWGADSDKSKSSVGAISVLGPDGRILEFPPEMTEREVTVVLRRLYSLSNDNSRIFNIIAVIVSIPIIFGLIMAMAYWTTRGFMGKSSDKRE
ncbi:hypothetical protein [Nitrospirillum iridis]|uniref:Uncharacterized protein n=1 Tax=Nitrospirillum iridis TaxID=765888 RepID=A0A7X0ATM5_9PROT|nr:hypothetical protein [Nitrospirillum iridis]MBB6249904.1 hypothetical protein [Nitrospirillum iridis]